MLRVNGTELDIERAVSTLDVLWQDTGLATRLVNACIVEEAVTTAGGDDLTDAELQAAMDAFRRARGLITARQVEEWMAERGLTHGRLEQLVTVEANLAELRRRVAGDQVEGYFAEHRGDLDRVRVVRIRYADRTAAATAADRLRAGADPAALATEAALAGLATARIEGVLREELSSAEAGPGSVLGPDQIDGGFWVTAVLAVEPATLDDSTRQLVERRVFDAWLRDRRRDAHLEWFWGSTARTDRLTAELRASTSTALTASVRGPIPRATRRWPPAADRPARRRRGPARSASWWRRRVRRAGRQDVDDLEVVRFRQVAAVDLLGTDLGPAREHLAGGQGDRVGAFAQPPGRLRARASSAQRRRSTWRRSNSARRAAKTSSARPATTRRRRLRTWSCRVTRSSSPARVRPRAAIHSRVASAVSRPRARRKASTAPRSSASPGSCGASEISSSIRRALTRRSARRTSSHSTSSTETACSTSRSVPVDPGEDLLTGGLAAAQRPRQRPVRGEGQRDRSVGRPDQQVVVVGVVGGLPPPHEPDRHIRVAAAKVVHERPGLGGPRSTRRAEAVEGVGQHDQAPSSSRSQTAWLIGRPVRFSIHSHWPFGLISRKT